KAAPCGLPRPAASGGISGRYAAKPGAARGRARRYADGLVATCAVCARGRKIGRRRLRHLSIRQVRRRNPLCHRASSARGRKIGLRRLRTCRSDKSGGAIPCATGPPVPEAEKSGFDGSALVDPTSPASLPTLLPLVPNKIFQVVVVEPVVGVGNSGSSRSSGLLPRLAPELSKRVWTGWATAWIQWAPGCPHPR